MVRKVTLSMNPEIVSRAKNYARQRRVSVSNLVETYLSAISNPPEASEDAPVLRALRGTLKNAELKEYRDHLVNKYL